MRLARLPRGIFHVAHHRPRLAARVTGPYISNHLAAYDSGQQSTSTVMKSVCMRAVNIINVSQCSSIYCTTVLRSLLLLYMLCPMNNESQCTVCMFIAPKAALYWVSRSVRGGLATRSAPRSGASGTMARDSSEISSPRFCRLGREGMMPCVRKQ